MAKVKATDMGGKGAGDVELDDAIFAIQPNVPVMHQVVTAQLGAKRAGTQSTLTRAEVRGGGAKPWKQKGTGKGRAGSMPKTFSSRSTDPAPLPSSAFTSTFMRTPPS